MNDYQLYNIISTIQQQYGILDKSYPISFEQMYEILKRFQYESSQFIRPQEIESQNRIMQLESRIYMMLDKHQELINELNQLKMFLTIKNVFSDDEYDDFKKSLLMEKKLTSKV